MSAARIKAEITQTSLTIRTITSRTGGAQW
jgi:hypothetical protein